LTLIPFFLFTRRLTGRPEAALAATAFLAFSSWHMVVCRFQFPTVFDPLLLLFSLWLLLEGAACQGSRRTALLLGLSGLCAGLAVQTYHTGRLAPVVAVLVGAPLFHARPDRWRAASSFALGLSLALAPLALWVASNPRAFHSREQQIFVAAVAASEAEAPLAAIDASWGRHLVMLNFRGDMNPRWNVPGRPMLDPLTGALFLVGLVWLVLRAEPRLRRALLVMASLGLLPSVLAVGGPHSLRAIDLLAPACLIAGLGWMVVLSGRKRAAADRPPRPSSRRLWWVAPAAVLLLNGLYFFVTLANDPRWWQASYAIDTQMGQFIRGAVERSPERRFYVHQGLLEARRSVLPYLSYGLSLGTYADGEPSSPPRVGDLFLVSSRSRERELELLRPVLGTTPRPTLQGPTLPGTDTPSFLVYEVRRPGS
jgi:hypothetical protein